MFEIFFFLFFLFFFQILFVIKINWFNILILVSLSHENFWTTENIFVSLEIFSISFSRCSRSFLSFLRDVFLWFRYSYHVKNKRYCTFSMFSPLSSERFCVSLKHRAMRESKIYFQTLMIIRLFIHTQYWN